MGSGSRRWLTTLVLHAACFTEQEPTAQGCPPASAGCACAGTRCDAGLACEPEFTLCVPDGCNPGTELCTCHEGECIGALRCEGGLCRPPDPATGTGDSADATSVAQPTASGVTNADGESSTAIGTDATSLSSSPSEVTGDPTDATSSGDPSMSTTGAGEDDSGVDGAACHACVLDAGGSGGECEMALVACGSTSECVELASCVTDCIDTDSPMCIPVCCTAHPAGTVPYADLSSCWQGACPAECSEFPLQC